MSFLIGIIFFIVAIALFVLVFFFSILRNVLSVFFGKPKAGTAPKERIAQDFVNKKISKQEGEYVDFEEIKGE